MPLNESSHRHIGETEAEGGLPEHPCCTKDRMEREWKEFRLSQLQAADPVRKAEAARQVVAHFSPDIDPNPGQLSAEVLAVPTCTGSGVEDVDSDTDESDFFSKIDHLQLQSFEYKRKELTHLAKHGYGVIVDCKGEYELKEILSHQQPVMVYIYDEETKQLNSEVKQSPLDFITRNCSLPALAAYRDNRLVAMTPLVGEMVRRGEFNDVVFENWLFHTGILDRVPPNAKVLNELLNEDVKNDMLSTKNTDDDVEDDEPEEYFQCGLLGCR